MPATDFDPRRARTGIPNAGKMDLLLLTALRPETLAVRASLDNWQQSRTDGAIVGMLGSCRAALVQMGVGPDCARRAAGAALARFSPRRAFVIGFAGGLDPSLRAGDLVVADRVLHGTESIDLSVERCDVLPSAVGPVLTVGRFVGAPLAKRALFETTHALAVDMESFPVAEACWQRQIPLSVVRAISDTADTALPNGLIELVDSSGDFHSASALWQLTCAPGLWPHAFRLFRATRRAAAVLQRFLRNLATRPSGR